jgi:hypothetical protein
MQALYRDALRGRMGGPTSSVMAAGQGSAPGHQRPQGPNDKQWPEYTNPANGAAPQRPPLAYQGDPVFSLPQRRWGVVECLANAPGGCRYGVRFPNGRAVVLAGHELVR